MLFVSDCVRSFLLWLAGKAMLAQDAVWRWQLSRVSPTVDWEPEAETQPAKPSQPVQRTVVPLPSFWDEHGVNSRGGVG